MTSDSSNTNNSLNLDLNIQEQGKPSVTPAHTKQAGGGFAESAQHIRTIDPKEKAALLRRYAEQDPHHGKYNKLLFVYWPLCNFFNSLVLKNYSKSKELRSFGGLVTPSVYTQFGILSYIIFGFIVFTQIAGLNIFGIIIVPPILYLALFALNFLLTGFIDLPETYRVHPSTGYHWNTHMFWDGEIDYAVMRTTGHSSFVMLERLPEGIVVSYLSNHDFNRSAIPSYSSNAKYWSSLFPSDYRSDDMNHDFRNDTRAIKLIKSDKPA